MGIEAINRFRLGVLTRNNVVHHLRCVGSVPNLIQSLHSNTGCSSVLIVREKG